MASTQLHLARESPEVLRRSSISPLLFSTTFSNAEGVKARSTTELPLYSSSISSQSIVVVPVTASNRRFHIVLAAAPANAVAQPPSDKEPERTEHHCWQFCRPRAAISVSDTPLNQRGNPIWSSHLYLCIHTYRGKGRTIHRTIHTYRRGHRFESLCGIIFSLSYTYTYLP